MKGAFDRRLRGVRHRWAANVLLKQVGAILILVGAVAALAVLTERVLATRFVEGWHVLAAFGAGLLAAGGLWLTRRPSRMQAAMLLDKRLSTRERF
ncbi:hypothetical protein LCGC14_1735340, partial [marine sediment metagenome]